MYFKINKKLYELKVFKNRYWYLMKNKEKLVDTGRIRTLIVEDLYNTWEEEILVLCVLETNKKFKLSAEISVLFCIEIELEIFCCFCEY